MLAAVTHTEESGAHLPLFDLSELGTRLRYARKLAGYATPEEMNEALEKRFGITFSKRSIYAVERGEQMPSAEMLFVVTLLCSPPGGLDFFAVAVDDHERKQFERLYRATPQ